MDSGMRGRAGAGANTGNVDGRGREGNGKRKMHERKEEETMQ